MLLEIVLPLLGGGILLAGGGEALVRGGVGVAAGFRLSPAVIGVTLLGFGTSTPELLASLQAALIGSAPIAVANVVGSSSANILLILGVTALVAPIAVARGALQRDMIWMVASALALAAALASGGLPRWIGGVGVALLIVYAVQALRSPQAAEEAGVLPGPIPKPPSPRLAVDAGIAVAGLVAAIVGAGFFVDGAVALAQASGLSEAVIGATVVAVGTSLPELAASLSAARRGESGMALGNVVGSNVFNILGVLGVSALVVPLATPVEVFARDIWVMLAATAVLVALMMGPSRIGRIAGGGLLVGYAGYLALML